MTLTIHDQLVADAGEAAADSNLRARARAAHILASSEGHASLEPSLDSSTYGQNMEHNNRLARLEVFLGMRDRVSVGGGALGYLDRQTVEDDIRRANDRAARLWGWK